MKILQFISNNIAFIYLVLIMLISIGNTQANISDRDIGDTIDAVHYDIHLEYIDIGQQTIQGYTTVELTTKIDNLEFVFLQLMDLSVDSVKVEGAFINDFIHYDPLLEIQLNSPISTGDTIDVVVYYNGHPYHDGWGGFNFSGDYVYNLGVSIDNIPHNMGKSWFPCVDNFTDRATYDCHITVGEGMTAVCGGMLQGKTQNDYSQTYHWSLPQEIPSYLASVATGNYVLWEDTYHGIVEDIPVNIYVRPQDLDKVDGSFVHLNEITNIYETHFGPYRWDRIGYVGTAVGGAMEHATNIAYSNSSINGNLSDESLMAHELFHMWFGDLVTCCSAEEMWINEGWATFCQVFYLEDLYSYEDFKTAMSEMNATVLQYCHTTGNGGDGAYFPLNEIPQIVTYGMTAYDRGATVVQSLRAYLGDDLFFDAITAFLNEYAFTSICSEEMENFLTDFTEFDMNGFFENWVYHAGTPGYIIDSFSVEPSGNGYSAQIYPGQKRKGNDYIGNANIIEVTFMDSNWEMSTDTLMFDGKQGHSVKQLESEPILVMIDLEEKMCDATTDSYYVFNVPEEYNFPNTFFGLDVTTLSDSAFVRVTHHWLPPDTLEVPIPGLTLSDYRYWKIEGIIPEEFTAEGRFFYSKPNMLDNTLITSSEDSIIILYRPSAASAWEGIDFTKEGIYMVGNLYVQDLQMGEYTLAVWDTQLVGTDERISNHKVNDLKVFPNPAQRIVNIGYDFTNDSRLEMFNSSGQLVDSINLTSGLKSIQWDTHNHTPGVYYIILIDKGNEFITQSKIVIQ